MSDSQIRQKIVGAWMVLQSEMWDGITYYPDGIWVAKYSTPRKDYSHIEDGTWEVKDGFIIKTTSEMTQARNFDSEFGFEHLKVIGIDNDSLILCRSGTTNEIALKKL
jgi:hypothetical protein